MSGKNQKRKWARKRDRRVIAHAERNARVDAHYLARALGALALAQVEAEAQADHVAPDDEASS